MDDSKAALSYTQRYTVNYYRKTVIALILQQCRISKISSSVMNILCTLLEQVITRCIRSVSTLGQGRNLPIITGFDYVLNQFSRTFMSTTPKDFALQQYIDFLINHKRVSPAENISMLFGQRGNHSPIILILPKSNSEIIDS